MVVAGGALALCVADRIVILENAVLSVISPKACAEILWKDVSKEQNAAVLMKMTANDLFKEKIVDHIILEGEGGAHNDSEQVAERINEYLIQELKSLNKSDKLMLIKHRRKRFRKMGR